MFDMEIHATHRSQNQQQLLTFSGAVSISAYIPAKKQNM